MYCGNAASCAVTITSPKAGDLLVVAAAYDSSGATIKSASGAGTWVHPSSCSANLPRYETTDFIYSLSATSGTTISVTMSTTVQYLQLLAVEYSGNGPFSFDVCAGLVDSTSSANPPGAGVKTSGVNDLALSLVYIDPSTIASGSAVTPSPWQSTVLWSGSTQAIAEALNFGPQSTAPEFTASGVATMDVSSTIAFKDSTTAPSGSYSVTGTVSGPPRDFSASNIEQVSNGSSMASVSVSGVYSFSKQPDGTYTLTPSARTGYTYSPAKEQITINNANVTVPAMSAILPSLAYSIANDQFTSSGFNAVNEGAPQGMPSDFSQYEYASLGPALDSSHHAIEGWGGYFQDAVVTAGTQPAPNTLVQVRNFQVCYLNSGKWTCTAIPAAQYSAEYDSEDWQVYLGQMTPVPQADGSVDIPFLFSSSCNGTLPPDLNTDACVSHFYPENRIAVTPSTFGGAVVYLEARLALANTSGNDDRANARYLLCVGADEYLSTTSQEQPPITDIVFGKAKYVEEGWRSFSATTLSLSQLTSNPPPLTIGSGVAP
jgi:hypothetical protein